MSSNLRAEPVERKKLDLSTELKFALRKRFGEPVNTQMSARSIDYLRGLSDCDIKDADKLIEYIEKYGEILVREENINV